MLSTKQVANSLYVIRPNAENKEFEIPPDPQRASRRERVVELPPCVAAVEGLL
jgi:hypothetical protein